MDGLRDCPVMGYAMSDLECSEAMYGLGIGEAVAHCRFCAPRSSGAAPKPKREPKARPAQPATAYTFFMPPRVDLAAPVAPHRDARILALAIAATAAMAENRDGAIPVTQLLDGYRRLSGRADVEFDAFAAWLRELGLSVVQRTKRWRSGWSPCLSFTLACREFVNRHVLEAA